MNIIDSVFNKQEKIAFQLRELYASYSYEQFRMNKFEEYDFYAKKKDFLVSDNIITFTDTNGRLMALRPDVTLSIVRNTRDSDGTKKLYYHENVYRPSDNSFKEIPQVGVEVIGSVKHSDTVEIITLACKSLELLSDDYLLELSDEALFNALKASEYGKHLRLETSLSENNNYYNELAFRGYVPEIPDYCLSGGRYDSLMRQMGRKADALGFAVYLDKLDVKTNTDEYLNVALPKGRLGEGVYKKFADSGYECPELLEKTRKLIFENHEKKVRYFWVKPSDVAKYVERGVADIGVVGKDILLEQEPAIYELLDLEMGKCRMAVAAPKDFADDRNKTLKVATKFTNIAQTYYNSLGRDIDIIELNGSIEIAPILGLSDVIVDIVETGTTLRENDLEVFETIVPISARLISNRTSYKFKREQIETLKKGMKND